MKLILMKANNSPTALARYYRKLKWRWTSCPCCLAATAKNLPCLSDLQPDSKLDFFLPLELAQFIKLNTGQYVLLSLISPFQVLWSLWRPLNPAVSLHQWWQPWCPFYSPAILSPEMNPRDPSFYTFHLLARILIRVLQRHRTSKIYKVIDNRWLIIVIGYGDCESPEIS